ncbi:hypothetical protein FBY40_1770 [Microbacterium sp. SLBN-154]|nr:hypothetical protein FBY40_1770 [Microbacterium sp. SLBN-154]
MTEDRRGRSDDRRDRPSRDSRGKDAAGRDSRADRPRQAPGDRTPSTDRGKPPRSGADRREGGRPSSSRRDDERRSAPRRDGDARRDGDRRTASRREGERSGGPRRDGDRGSRPRRDDSSRHDERRSRPPQSERIPEPDLPEDVTPRSLDAAARNQLKTLSKENAEAVARHLAMAALLIDEDPTRAHEHALAATRRAGRVAVVRETAAITAYAVGDFALALRELRTYRRISGRDDQIALMVDSERGVGRPDRALEVGRAVDRTVLPTDVRVHLAIAMSGARLDLGETERALQELDIPELDPDRAFAWSSDLFAARATVLEELGRHEEAASWRARADVAADVIAGANGDDQWETVEIAEVIEEMGDGDAVSPSAGDDAGERS